MSLGKIVLADGDESVRRMLSRVLESYGYEVQTATNAGEVVRVCREHDADILLLDPELENGPWTAARALRAQGPHPGIIVMGSWPNPIQGVQPGLVDAVIEKPLDLPQLLATVAKLLQDRREHPTGAKPVPGFLLLKSA